MALLMSAETEKEFRKRLGLDGVVSVQDCSRYWEVEIKGDRISKEDFLRLNIEKVTSCRGSKCFYIPKL